MKNVVMIIGLFLFLAELISAQDPKPFGKKVAEGNTYTSFGKYTVELSEIPVILNGEKVSKYRITYEKSPIAVLVYVDKSKRCRNYIVVSDTLAVMYSCNGKYFGINLIDPKYERNGFVTNNKNIIRASYFRQKIISPGRQEELNATTLIASYFPQLVENN